MLIAVIYKVTQISAEILFSVCASVCMCAHA